jgi:hypothetical protein
MKKVLEKVKVRGHPPPLKTGAGDVTFEKTWIIRVRGFQATLVFFFFSSLCFLWHLFAIATINNPN